MNPSSDRVSWVVGPTVASLAATLYTLACPPYEWPLAAWFAPGLLLVMTRELPPRTAFVTGMLFGLLIGWGVAGWMRDASLAYFGFAVVPATAFVVTIWLVALGLPYGALLCVHASLARRVPPAGRPVVAAWLWVLADLVRAHLTDMPWQLLGHTQYSSLIGQIADLGGVHLVSFVLVLVSVGGCDAACDLLWGALTRQGAVRRLVPAVACAIAALAYGADARARNAPSPGDGPSARLAVIQLNVPAAFRWRPEHFQQMIHAYAASTAAAASAHPDLLVWPENAANFYLAREPRVLGQLGRVATFAQHGLVVGGPRLANDGTSRSTVYVIGPHGEIRGYADKRKLVPFAEFSPLGDVLGLRPSTGPRFVAGTVSRPLEVSGLRIGATVCYEIIFPGVVRDLVRRGADVLVNVANDGWLGPPNGAAAWQHFSIAVFRAIETRRTLVRAAAGGISGFVGPDGTPYARVPETRGGMRLAPVQPRSGETPYVRFGEAWVLVVGIPVILVVRRSRQPALALRVAESS